MFLVWKVMHLYWSEVLDAVETTSNAAVEVADALNVT